MLLPANPNVSAEEPIPYREYRTVIAVGLVERHRMMETVHVDCDQHRLQPALQPLGEPDVAVLHGSGGEQRQAMARRGNRGQVEHEHRDPYVAEVKRISTGWCRT